MAACAESLAETRTLTRTRLRAPYKTHPHTEETDTELEEYVVADHLASCHHFLHVPVELRLGLRMGVEHGFGLHSVLFGFG